jgi:hypothetical protein
MLFALVVMAGLVLLVAIFNNLREPAWWDGRLPHRKRRSPADGSAWAFGGDSGIGFERYRQTREHPEPIPITASVLLELLDGCAPDVVPIDEHKFSYFAIRLDDPTMDLSKWVRVRDTSPLFAELQSRRRGFGV